MATETKLVGCSCGHDPHIGVCMTKATETPCACLGDENSPLPQTPLGELAELLRAAQKANTRAGDWHPQYARMVGESLIECGLFVDMVRGDGQ